MIAFVIVCTSYATLARGLEEAGTMLRCGQLERMQQLSRSHVLY